ncbi:MAG: EAL domain-containing protein [Mycetocola sp.]
MSIDTDLAGAVDRAEIVAWFQPQIDIATGQVAAVEALSRWNSPHRGLVSPTDFIPAAERTGLIHEIGAFMLEEGCRQAARWRNDGRAIDVSVNVSAMQLARPEIFNWLHEMLQEHTLPDGALTIEITESQMIADVDGVAARLCVLRELGLGISLDDFGTGRSSLAQLQDLPITELKIDRSLVQEDTNAIALVAVAVALLQERGVRVVAEGVETVEQLDRVRELHCDRAQGFLFGRPVPVGELDELLAQT